VLVVGVVEVMVLNEVMAMALIGVVGGMLVLQVMMLKIWSVVMIPEVMVMTLALVGLIERMLDL